MSLTVVVLAAAHAVPVVLARVIGSRKAAWITAVVMSIIAVGTGAQRYAVAVLAAIWIVAFLVTRA